MASQGRAQVPVRSLVNSQIAFGGWLTAGDGQEFSIRAEASIVDRTQHVGQKLGRSSGGQIPNDDLAVAAGHQPFSIVTKGDSRHRRQRPDLQNQFEFSWISRSKQTLRRNRVSV